MLIPPPGGKIIMSPKTFQSASGAIFELLTEQDLELRKLPWRQHIFDIYAPHNMREYKSFFRQSGALLARLAQGDWKYLAFYCPFPREMPLLDYLHRLKRTYKIIDGNLAFPLLDIPNEAPVFASTDLFYFGLAFYIAGQPHQGNAIYPPKSQQMGDPWQWFLKSHFPLVAQLSRDHPGLLVGLNMSLSREEISDLFKECFGEP